MLVGSTPRAAPKTQADKVFSISTQDQILIASADVQLLYKSSAFEQPFRSDGVASTKQDVIRAQDSNSTFQLRFSPRLRL